MCRISCSRGEGRPVGSSEEYEQSACLDRRLTRLFLSLSCFANMRTMKQQFIAKKEPTPLEQDLPFFCRKDNACLLVYFFRFCRWLPRRPPHAARRPPTGKEGGRGASADVEGKGGPVPYRQGAGQNVCVCTVI